MIYELIRAELSGRVLILTLNRPSHHNAAPPALFDELSVALDHLDGVGAIIITGEGEAFCMGADLAGHKTLDRIAPDMQARRALTRNYNPLMVKLSRVSIPTITAVNGPAVGIGCSLALAADFCFASVSAYFRQAFVGMDLVPDGRTLSILATLIGKPRATEMTLLGERISATRAAEWGLIHKVTADTALMNEAMALAERLATGPGIACGQRQALTAALESEYRVKVPSNPADDLDT